MESREWTEEEVRSHFLNHVHAMVEFWLRDDLDLKGSPDELRERLEGLAFSILSTIDGSSVDVPAFILAPKFLLVPCPHPEDKEWLIQEGENYYRPVNEDDIAMDIAGDLHHQFNNPDIYDKDF